MKLWVIFSVGIIFPSWADDTARPAEKTPDPAAAPAITKLDAQRTRIGQHLTIDAVSRVITLPAQVTITKELLEYLLVTDTGKVHETLLRTPVTAMELQLALLLLSYEKNLDWWPALDPPQLPSKPVSSLPAACQLEIFVRWTPPAVDGKKPHEVEVPVGEWFENREDKNQDRSVPWVYTGSEFTKEKTFAAQVDGSLIAIYLDRRALINNSLPGHGDDMLWLPTKKVPPNDTAVTLVLKPIKTAADPSESKSELTK